MLKPLVDFSRQIFALTRDVQQCKSNDADHLTHDKEQDTRIEALETEVRELRFELRRERDERERDRTDYRREHENLALRLQVLLLQAGIGLPSGSAKKKIEEEPDE